MVDGLMSNRFFRQSFTRGQPPPAAFLFMLQFHPQFVFFGQDFITVTKRLNSEWYLIKPAILGVIMEHFTAGRAVLLDDDAADHAASEAAAAEEDSEVVVQIKELLDTRVRPAVAQDGGDIVFEGFDDGIVYLHMQGACSGCPSSTATLKMGIENMLRHYIPEVVEVRQI